MNSVTFKNLNNVSKNAYTDWGIILKPKKRPKPTPKYNYISIPARNGDLDLTEELGEVYYNNLTFPLEFSVVDDMSDWDEKLRTITNFLHGKEMYVTFSDDDAYYYKGRVKVNELSSNKGLGILVLECNFEPYKYKQSETTKQYTVSAGGSYTFTNNRMKVVPTLTLSTSMTITFNGTSYSLSAGTQKILGIEFIEGTNTIGVTTGSGTLKAVYREGTL